MLLFTGDCSAAQKFTVYMYVSFRYILSTKMTLPRVLIKSYQIVLNKANLPDRRV